LSSNDTKNSNKQLYIILGVVYEFFAFILSCHMGIYKKNHLSATFSEELSGGFAGIRENFLHITPITGEAWKMFVYISLGTAFVLFVMYNSAKTREVSMKGREGGSAGWNNKLGNYNKKYTDPAGSSKSNLYPSDNMILSQDVYLSMNTRQTRQNNNILCIGGSGSGKSRFFIKPNLLQANANYICTDPSGELLSATGKFLENQGYTIKVFNLVDMTKSHKYNPFMYIHPGKDEEVLTLVDCLIENTTEKGKSGGDPFWLNSEKLLLRALCFYLIEKEPVEHQNWGYIMELLNRMKIDEEKSATESEVDRMFNILEKENPASLAVAEYKAFKQGGAKTLKSIIISCTSRLNIFTTTQVKNLVEEDDMELERLCNEKMAYFIITPQTTNTFNFLVAMLYSQMFQVLYYEGNNRLEKGERFPYEIRFMLDEFVNIGRIPEFDVKIATMRKYRISANVVLQNIKQLEPLYEASSTIVGNCDTLLYLGGIDKESAEYISALLGKQTIRTGNTSHSSGKSSYSESFSYQGRELMTPDEIVRMPKDTCIVIPAGQRPFKTKKFDLTKHPNYKFTGDADSKYLYVNNINTCVKKESETEEKTISKDDSFKFECEFRDTIKKYSDSLPEITSLSEFISNYEKSSTSGIFEEMSEIKKNINITKQERNIINKEVSKVVLKNINQETARRIIEQYKEKSLKNMAKKSSSGELLLNTIKDNLTEEDFESSFL
jgi:type IV secretory pathway TraG/TraD family ATPase VirD4